MKQLLHYFLLLFLLVGCKSVQGFDEKIISHNDKRIVFEGRIGENKSKAATEIYWTGSSVKINVEGTAVSAVLEDEHGTNYFNIIIDDTIFNTLKLNKGKSTYVLAKFNTVGKHSVKLTKRNDYDFGTTLLYSFNVNGNVLPPATKKKLFIEFYGDSITSGHGNEDNSTNDAATGDVTNNYNAYGAITARNLNAEYTCIARSGIGIMVSWYNLIMPELFDRLNPNDSNSKWDFSKKQPDIVVVNLFQNDSWIVNRPNHEEFIRRFGTEKPSEEKTIEAYKSFVQKVRSKYPKSAIVCMLGNMDITQNGSKWPDYVSAAVQKLNDNNVFTTFVPFKNTKKHPTVGEQQSIANELIKTIKERILIQ